MYKLRSVRHRLQLRDHRVIENPMLKTRHLKYPTLLNKGMLQQFGPMRVVDSPISEAGITGLGVGAASGCACGASPAAGSFSTLVFRAFVVLRPFVLTERITVSGAPEHRAALATMTRITIKGTLDYQACDDRVCFLPASIPVSYTVKLRRP